MATLVLDDVDAVPLGNEPVYVEDAVVGQTTSAAFGHRVGRPVALAYLCTKALPAVDASRVEIDVAGRRFTATARTAAAL